MKVFKLSAAVASCLLVAACLFSPGRFDAQLNVRKDGSFTYRYTGEILLLTAHSAMLAAQGMEGGEDSFDPEGQLCWDGGSDDMGPDPDLDAPASFAQRPVTTMPVPVEVDVDASGGRPCSAKEIETRRKAWEANRAARRQEKERETAMMKAILGGMDPSDPETMTEYARRLQGQGGWKKVTFKGNGLFEVDYEISGRLDHDFIFPVFDGMEIIVPFVQATQAGAGRIRVTAPAFVRPTGDRSGMSAMGAAGAAAMMGKGDKGWPFKPPEGTFTLTTDAEILTNNTRDGPAAQGASKVLRWTVGPLDTTKPEALLRL
jgi:hypothetical protein